MLFSLNPASGVPLYRQLLQQLRERMAGGQLESGQQLPSVRDLSAQLHINPLTVAKVYQFLEREGLVETRRGLGTFVAARTRPLPVSERRKQLQPALRQLAAEALHLGVTEDELQTLLSRTFMEMKTSKPPKTHE